MPRLPELDTALDFLAPVLDADPVATLKMQALLEANLGHVEFVAVDDLENPTATAIKAGRFVSFFGFDMDGVETVLDELDWSRQIAFSGVWAPLLPLVEKRMDVAWREPCRQFFLAEQEGMVEHLSELAENAEGALAPDEAIVSTLLDAWPYGSADSAEDRDYITQRLTFGLSAYCMVDGELVSWAATSGDSSMGFFHTKPGYRHLGLGKAVAAHLTLQVWNLGLTPFCFVAEGNNAPISLLENLGFVEADDPFVWLGN